MSRRLIFLVRESFVSHFLGRPDPSPSRSKVSHFYGIAKANRHYFIRIIITFTACRPLYTSFLRGVVVSPTYMISTYKLGNVNILYIVWGLTYFCLENVGDARNSHSPQPKITPIIIKVGELLAPLFCICGGGRGPVVLNLFSEGGFLRLYV